MTRTTPPAYEDIDTIDDCAFDRLRDLLRDGRASTRDKVTWAKAHFQRRILRDWTAVDPKTCAGMFSVWIRDQTGVAERLDNIRREKSDGSRQRYHAGCSGFLQLPRSGASVQQADTYARCWACLCRTRSPIACASPCSRRALAQRS